MRDRYRHCRGSSFFFFISTNKNYSVKTSEHATRLAIHTSQSKSGELNLKSERIQPTLQSVAQVLRVQRQHAHRAVIEADHQMPFTGSE